MDEQPARLRDLARVFLKIGAMSYGGPAIMGIMQNEIQERRRWLDKERFRRRSVDREHVCRARERRSSPFSSATPKAVLPAASLPAFASSFRPSRSCCCLASAYGAFGALPAMRNAFYGIGPVVVGISPWRSTGWPGNDQGSPADSHRNRCRRPHAVQSGRPGRDAVGSRLRRHGTVSSPGAPVRRLYCCWFSPWPAAYAAEGFVVGAALPIADPGPRSTAAMATLWDVGAFFFKVGTFTCGGGLSMLASCRTQGRRSIRLADAAGVRRRPGAGAS